MKQWWNDLKADFRTQPLSGQNRVFTKDYTEEMHQCMITYIGASHTHPDNLSKPDSARPVRAQEMIDQQAAAKRRTKRAKIRATLAPILEDNPEENDPFNTEYIEREHARTLAKEYKERGPEPEFDSGEPTDGEERDSAGVRMGIAMALSD